ncbi:MAG: replicative DNA helicase [Candidatus Sungiibacteriota bacterium]
MARNSEKGGGARVPPQNIDAEMSVLGALMLDKEAIFRVLGTIQPPDFYKPTHQLIYRAMLDLAEKNEPIDVVSMKSRLKERKELDAVGGMTYLTTLVNTVPTASSVNHWARVVQRKRIHRDLIAAASHISEIAYDEKADIEKLLDEAEQKIFGISQNSLQQIFMHVKEALEEAWQRIEEVHSGEHKYRGIETGFIDLDKKLSGLQKSDLIVLAARPSLGKTALALDIARRVAKNKIPVGVFSIEMSKDQVVDRLLAAEAKVDLWKLRTGNLSDDDLGALQKAMNALSAMPIFIDDVASPTIMQIRAMARRLQAQEKQLGLVVVDYLQLIQSSNNTESRVQEVSEISRALKALAKELNIPVLAISQLSRAVEMRQDSIPKLSDLRESGSIEQDADVVMFIYRPDLAKKNLDKKNIAEIHIAKHRNGPTGNIELAFNENAVSFYDLAKNAGEDPFS